MATIPVPDWTTVNFVSPYILNEDGREVMLGDTASGPALIGIDWGTTNRRGYLLNRNGQILESRQDGLGLSKVAGGDFGGALQKLIGDWLSRCEPLPVLMSGMVGASTGWLDAGYCSVPVGLEELSEKLASVVASENVWIVPGVRTIDKAKMPDVIRGEEVQSLSIGGDRHDAVVIIPGTHCKWIRIKGQKITSFTTFLTGDLYSAILNHTVISMLRTRTEIEGHEAFCRGVEIGYSEHANLMNVLFGARTNVLFKTLMPGEVSHYTSGLLIGAEIASGISIIGSAQKSMVLLGSDSLIQRYELAFSTCGINVDIIGLEAVGSAYIEIARSAGLVR